MFTEKTKEEASQIDEQWEVDGYHFQPSEPAEYQGLKCLRVSVWKFSESERKFRFVTAIYVPAETTTRQVVVDYFNQS